jgi:hypothetical protein
MVVNMLDLFTIRASVKPTFISEASTSLIQRTTKHKQKTRDIKHP